MTSKILAFLLLVFLSVKVKCQIIEQGLEGIIVEKYYVSGKDDLAANDYAGKLRKNATTYRIFVDLLPQYRFQAAYGSKEHPLYFKTSTSFFNNTDKGGVAASLIPMRNLGKNTVMLDSWLSVGTSGELTLGIPKNDDDTSKLIEFQSGFLNNKSKCVTFSPREKDGLKYTLDMPLHTLFGLDSVIQTFGYKGGNEFYVDNGAWACMGKGSMGVDSLSHNRVLIAQLTTDGTLEFELNLQILTPEGKVQRFVARNPQGQEFISESLVRTRKSSINKKTK
jgi:hypothetical protein